MDFVPFPRFSSEKLSIWFAQAESAFTLNGVLTDSDKYDYVVTHIPPEYTTMVEDIILNPPTCNRYEEIKYEFIKRMSIYKLNEEEIGNKKPSEYLHKLKAVAGQRIANEIVLNIWLNNLPKEVREIVSLETSGRMDTLCEMADKVMALVTSTPSPKHIEELPSKQFGMILRRIDELSKQVQIVQLMIDGEYEEDAPGKQHSVNIPGGSQKEAFNVLNTSTNGSPKVICWYHTIFGDRAVACVAPCQYKFSPTEYFLRQ